jgi:hypothetical protein
MTLPERSSFDICDVFQMLQERRGCFGNHMKYSHACFEILHETFEEGDEVFSFANIAGNGLFE